MLDVGEYHVIIVIRTEKRTTSTEAASNTTGRNIVFNFLFIVVFHCLIYGLREFRIDNRRMASGFGGLEVSEFAGSNPAEAI